MKYNGLIIWLDLKKDANIYQHEKDFEVNAKIYNSNVTAIIEGNEFDIFFNITGWGYSVKFRHITSNIYEGEILKMNEVQGTAILHLYSFEGKHLCKIHWNEDKAYECIMELNSSE